MNETLTHLDCFSGLGAWTLAGHWLGGIRTVAFVENDKRCQDFLAKAWPGIPIEPDIRTLDGKRYLGIDILTAGVPCQPASRAGKQQGKGDHRWLWDDALRLVAEVGPRCCVFENPPGIEDVGLDGILAALEGQGYEVPPVFDIPACALNSPQLRHRYYIVAFACGERRQQDPRSASQNEGEHAGRSEAGNHKSSGSSQGAMALAGEGPSGWREVQPGEREEERTAAERSGSRDGGVGLADASESGHQRPNPEPRQDGRRAKHSQGDVAQSAEERRQCGTAQPRSPDEMGREAQCGSESGALTAQGDMANRPQRGLRIDRSASGNTGHADERTENALGDPENGERQRSSVQRTGGCQQSEKQGIQGTVGAGLCDAWKDYIWLPCADGKVRRAPGDSFSLVDGLHRSILGALGNSQVPQAAYKILEAVTQALTHP